MVSFVIVSHSAKLADGVIDLARMSAPEVPMFAAGGLEDGGYGTSFDRITAALSEAYSEDGVIVLGDLGSALMTAEMAIEASGLEKVELIDCPLVTGAVSGTVLSSAGSEFGEIVEELRGM